MPENGGMYDVVLRDAAQGQCVLTVVKRRVVIYRVHVPGEHVVLIRDFGVDFS